MISVSYITRKVNFLKNREKEQALKASNMETKYASSENKNIKTFKKSEILRLILLRTNHFISTLYEKRRGNLIEDTCTICKKEAVSRDHIKTRFIILKKKNLDWIRECKLVKSKMTQYSLIEERRRRRRKDPLF